MSYVIHKLQSLSRVGIHFGTYVDATPSPKLGPRWPSFKNAEVWGLEGPFPALSTKRGRGAC